MSLHSLARIGAGPYCICADAARTAHDMKCPLHPAPLDPPEFLKPTRFDSECNCGVITDTARSVHLLSCPLNPAYSMLRAAKSTDATNATMTTVREQQEARGCDRNKSLERDE